MSDENKKTLLKGLTQAFLNTPPEEEPVVEKKENSRKQRAEKKHTPSASEIAASIRKNMSFASKISSTNNQKVQGVSDDKKQSNETMLNDNVIKTMNSNNEMKMAVCSDVVYSAPMVHKINMTENGFMKKIPACKKVEPMKRPADETLIIAAKKVAASKHIQLPAVAENKESVKKEAINETTKEVAEKEVKKEVKKETTKKPVAKKETAKKEVVKKETAKKVVKKEVTKKEVKKSTPAKKEVSKKEVTKKEVASKSKAVTPVVEVQYNNNSYSISEIEKKAQEKWVAVSGKKLSDLKEMDLYIKPEDGKVYCVFNKNVNSDFDI